MPIIISRTTKNIVLSLLLVVFTVPSLAAENLRDILSHVYQTNPDIAAARQALSANNETWTQIYARWFPTITARATFNSSKSDSRSTGSFQLGSQSDIPTKNLSYELLVQQNLFRSGQDSAALKQALAIIMQQRLSLFSTEQQIFSNSVGAYANVLRDRAIVEFRKKSAKALQERLRQTAAQQKIGDRTQADLAQARSRFASAEADLEQSLASQVVSDATFMQIVGKKPKTLQAAMLVNQYLPSSLQEALTWAQGGNPSLAYSRWSLRAARHGVDVAVRQLGPTINLTGSFSESKYDSIQQRRGLPSIPVYQDRWTRGINIQLVVPIYSGGSTGSGIRRAHHEVSQNFYQVQAQSRAVEQQVISAWEQLHATRARLKSLQVARDSADVALKGITEEVGIGQRTIGDALDAERDLINAQVSYETSRQELVVQSYDLLQQVGRLSAADLELDVEPYPMEEEFRKLKAAAWLPGFMSVE